MAGPARGGYGAGGVYGPHRVYGAHRASGPAGRTARTGRGVRAVVVRGRGGPPGGRCGRVGGWGTAGYGRSGRWRASRAGARVAASSGWAGTDGVRRPGASADQPRALRPVGHAQRPCRARAPRPVGPRSRPRGMAPPRPASTRPPSASRRRPPAAADVRRPPTISRSRATTYPAAAYPSASQQSPATSRRPPTTSRQLSTGPRQVGSLVPGGRWMPKDVASVLSTSVSSESSRRAAVPSPRV